MTRHNKKRNVGLLYEFLVQTISKAIIEGNDKIRDVALSILRKHYKVGTEINKEFRLFHSLADTTVQSPSVAETILESAKKVSNNTNISKLEHEKSLLIRSINHKLQDESFYNKRVKEYKIYATIQTLLNEWRSKEINNIVKLAEFEEQLKEWLLTEKKVTPMQDTDSDPLVEKLMIKKINDKYSGILSEEQKEIIKNYLYSSIDKEDNLSQGLLKVKDNALNSIDLYLKENAGKDKFLDEKLKKAKILIIEENSPQINDEVIARYLDIAQLNVELKG